MTSKIKVAILDDHALFNAGMAEMIEEFDRYEIQKTFIACSEFLDWVEGVELDILITDLSMPEMSGMEIIRRIRRSSPKTKILVVSSISNEYSVKKCFLLGANGYLPKSMSKSDLAKALGHILEGKYYVASEVHQYLIQGVLKNEDLKNLVLTNREMEIIQLICDEFSSKEIAERLGISEFTVSNHRKSVLQKLGVRTVAGIMKYAILNGLA
jgi:DNA-binding NarL/FixJ family response regulator